MWKSKKWSRDLSLSHLQDRSGLIMPFTGVLEEFTIVEHLTADFPRPSTMTRGSRNHAGSEDTNSSSTAISDEETPSRNRKAVVVNCFWKASIPGRRGVASLYRKATRVWNPRLSPLRLRLSGHIFSRYAGTQTSCCFLTLYCW